MAAVLPLSEAELKLLASLARHKVKFMVVGLSGAALQGAPVVTQDIDLWFENLADPHLAEALREVGAGYVPPFGLNPPMLAGTGSEPFDVVLRMDGLAPFLEEYRRALDIAVGRVRLKVLPLERILASKEAANRPKDKLVLQVLKDVLSSRRRHRRTKQRSRPR